MFSLAVVVQTASLTISTLLFKTSPTGGRANALDGEHGVATGLSFLNGTACDLLTG
jgi:hypothetical protein